MKRTSAVYDQELGFDKRSVNIRTRQQGLLEENGLGGYAAGLKERGIVYRDDLRNVDQGVIGELGMKPIHANKLRHLVATQAPANTASTNEATDATASSSLPPFIRSLVGYIPPGILTPFCTHTAGLSQRMGAGGVSERLAGGVGAVGEMVASGVGAAGGFLGNSDTYNDLSKVYHTPPSVAES